MPKKEDKLPDDVIAKIAQWVKRVQQQNWSAAYVFFKHEDEGKGPAFAKTFLESFIPTDSAG